MIRDTQRLEMPPRHERAAGRSVKGVLSQHRVWRALRKASPYVLVELLVPGGTLLALLLWLSSGLGRGLFTDAQAPRVSPGKMERVVALRRGMPKPFD